MRIDGYVSKSKKDEVASAIHQNFTSPNCSDSNMEAANVVDGLYAIARAICRLSAAIEEKEFGQ